VNRIKSQIKWAQSNSLTDNSNSRSIFKFCHLNRIAIRIRPSLWQIWQYWSATSDV